MTKGKKFVKLCGSRVEVMPNNYSESNIDELVRRLEGTNVIEVVR